jgi:hypothetical protein
MKNFTWLLALLFIGALASCSKDDDKEMTKENHRARIEKSTLSVINDLKGIENLKIVPVMAVANSLDTTGSLIGTIINKLDASGSLLLSAIQSGNTNSIVTAVMTLVASGKINAAMGTYTYNSTSTWDYSSTPSTAIVIKHHVDAIGNLATWTVVPSTSGSGIDIAVEAWGQQIFSVSCTVGLQLTNSVVSVNADIKAEAYEVKLESNLVTKVTNSSIKKSGKIVTSLNVTASSGGKKIQPVLSFGEVVISASIDTAFFATMDMTTSGSSTGDVTIIPPTTQAGMLIAINSMIQISAKYTDGTQIGDIKFYVHPDNNELGLQLVFINGETEDLVLFFAGMKDFMGAIMSLITAGEVIS